MTVSLSDEFSFHNLVLSTHAVFVVSYRKFVGIYKIVKNVAAHHSLRVRRDAEFLEYFARRI